MSSSPSPKSELVVSDSMAELVEEESELDDTWAVVGSAVVLVEEVGEYEATWEVVESSAELVEEVCE